MASSHRHEFEAALEGQRVLVTGATGFNGSWLSLWLVQLGAEVHGISLAPETSPSLFEAAGIDQHISHNIRDIVDRDGLIDLVLSIDPVFVFHLAAQPLVRRSYRRPLATFATNVLGTAHVLEACRRTKSTRAVVCITSDKVYRNGYSLRPHRESDPLGGVDPYSASKAGAELVAQCYRHSLNAQANGVMLATARGGNIIGGGDWAEDRLVPDFVRAVVAGEPLVVRNPHAIRPWQHVLSLCHGYMLLARRLADRNTDELEAWNFAPLSEETVSVERLLAMLGQHWRAPPLRLRPEPHLRESQLLAVDSSRARELLGWTPPWSLATAAELTVSWYRDYYGRPSHAAALMLAQIEQYRADLVNSPVLSAK